MHRRSRQFGTGSRAAVAASACILLAGCAGLTGRDWVNDAHDQQARVVSSARALPIPAIAEPDPSVAARPRLNHTVTLGEIDVAPTAQGADAAPSIGSGGPSVTINNYNVMNVGPPAYGYVGLGYGHASPAFSIGGTPRTTVPTLTPGQSWPAIADHGPSFPYHAGPASPWARSQ